MVEVVGSPYPVDDLPPLNGLLPAVQMQWETRLAVTTLLFYEYFLTLDQEIEYIWKHRWKPSTALYLFVRYFGTLYNLTATVLMLIRRSNAVSQFLFGAEAWAGFILWWAVQDTFAEHIVVTGLYYYEADVCAGMTTPTYAYNWAPCIAFEAILTVLALWAGIKRSRQRSYPRSARFNGPQLVDVLIQGNVIYFLCPLVLFVLFMKHNPSLEVQWLIDTILLRAPVTIMVGCRLVLSIRQTASTPDLDLVSTWMAAVSGGTTAHTSHGL
ncbi:hypothetical protein V8B97DRAFT_999002 [Scleroderma yunnanense]